MAFLSLLVVILVVINILIVVMLFESFRISEQTSKDFNNLLKVHADAMSAVSAKENVTVIQKVSETPIAIGPDYTLVVQVILLVLGIFIVYKGACFVTESSAYKLGKLIDKKTSCFLDQFLDSKTVTEFSEHSTGLKAIFTKTGKGCEILFRDPNDETLRTVADLVNAKLASSPALVETISVLSPKLQWCLM